MGCSSSSSPSPSPPAAAPPPRAIPAPSTPPRAPAAVPPYNAPILEPAAAVAVRSYIFQDGRLIRIGDESRVAVVSSPAELAAATVMCAEAGTTIVVPQPTQAAIELFFDPGFVAEFQAPIGSIQSAELLDALGVQFAKYEVPLGLLSQLLLLRRFRLNFIIDDSGSMQLDTDSRKEQAGSFMLQRFKEQGNNLKEPMSRWQEAEDRLHIIIGMLANIPTQTISVSFLNRSTKLSLDRSGRTPEIFIQEADYAIQRSFDPKPQSGTPIYSRLKEAFEASFVPTIHYLFTDGQPSDATPEQVCKLTLTRQYPENNPIVFVSCTNEDEATGWMKGIDEEGPFISEVDDYADEMEEVIQDQGKAFPFTKGLWLMCLLVGPLSPDILDALDEKPPISKFTLESVMGRSLTREEYMHYWNSHPLTEQYKHLLDNFISEPRCAKDIIANPNGDKYTLTAI